MSLEWSSPSDFLFFPKQEQQQEVPGSFQCSLLSGKQNPRSSSFMCAGSRSSSIGRMSPLPKTHSSTKIVCSTKSRSIPWWIPNNTQRLGFSWTNPTITGDAFRRESRSYEKRFWPWSSNPKASPRGALSAIIARNLGLWSSSRAWWVRRLLELRDVKRIKTPTNIIVWFFLFYFWGCCRERFFNSVLLQRTRAHTPTHAHFVCCREKTSLFLFQRHYPLVCCRNFDCKECCVYCCGNCILGFVDSSEREILQKSCRGESRRSCRRKLRKRRRRKRGG